MARDKRKESIYVPKPKPDIYVALLIVTFVCTFLATLLMWWESSLLSQ